jgi:copper oxidase (laccase) domain-containing protein
MIDEKIIGDAVITDLKGIAIGVKTADCVPILLYDRSKNLIAAVHSGWRGTSKNMLVKL